MIEKETALSKALIKVLIDFISETAGNKGKFSAARGHKNCIESAFCMDPHLGKGGASYEKNSVHRIFPARCRPVQ